MPPTHRAFAFRYSDFAAKAEQPITRFYNPDEDIGLGLTWQRFQDTRAVLGRELKGIEGNLLVEMLRRAADRGLGLFVILTA
jgi:hypothetical protein